MIFSFCSFFFFLSKITNLNPKFKLGCICNYKIKAPPMIADEVRKKTKKKTGEINPNRTVVASSTGPKIGEPPFLAVRMVMSGKRQDISSVTPSRVAI